jgi:hypothetical protein
MPRWFFSTPHYRALRRVFKGRFRPPWFATPNPLIHLKKPGPLGGPGFQNGNVG